MVETQELSFFLNIIFFSGGGGHILCIEVNRKRRKCKMPTTGLFLFVLLSVQQNFVKVVPDLHQSCQHCPQVRCRCGCAGTVLHLITVQHSTLGRGGIPLDYVTMAYIPQTPIVKTLMSEDARSYVNTFSDQNIIVISKFMSTLQLFFLLLRTEF